MEDRNIRLVDFIQIMLELKWKSAEIVTILSNYYKKGAIDSIDKRELFLLFAMKRKLKLMSHVINSEDFAFEFNEDNFIDVVENDVYDMAVLLYREYFLLIKKQQDKICKLLIAAFGKANGQLEAKAFLLKRFMTHMRFEQAAKFLEIIEYGIYDSSRGNIFVHTLNVVKAACLLIELLMAVKHQFGFMERRVEEIKNKILSIASQYMSQVMSEEEMRYLLLEKDLDNNDALILIYNFDLIDLL